MTEPRGLRSLRAAARAGTLLIAGVDFFASPLASGGHTRAPFALPKTELANSTRR